MLIDVDPSLDGIGPKSVKSGAEPKAKLGRPPPILWNDYGPTPHMTLQGKRRRREPVAARTPADRITPAPIPAPTENGPTPVVGRGAANAARSFVRVLALGLAVAFA